MIFAALTMSVTVGGTAQRWADDNATRALGPAIASLQRQIERRDEQFVIAATRDSITMTVLRSIVRAAREDNPARRDVYLDTAEGVINQYLGKP